MSEDREPNDVWKPIAISLFTFILGALIPITLNRNYVTKDYLHEQLEPIHAQLDTHSQALLKLADTTTQTQVDIGKLTAAAALDHPAGSHP